MPNLFSSLQEVKMFRIHAFSLSALTIGFSLGLVGCSIKTDPPEEGVSVRVSWNSPSLRENGDVLNAADIGGYHLKFRTQDSQDYEDVRLLSYSGLNPDAVYSFDTTDFVIDDWVDNADLDGVGEDWIETLPIAKGQYQFRVAVFDVDGLYSDWVEVSYNLQ